MTTTNRTTPVVGDIGPDFHLPADDGSTLHLAALRGRWVIVYFYPRDNTPGCTTEACDFRDRHGDFAASDAVVLGISGDSLASHGRFRDKFQLPFQLLSDGDRAAMVAWGAWGEKTLYGKTSMGIIRSTFLVAPDGRIAAGWPKVKVKGHVDEVLATLADLRART